MTSPQPILVAHLFPEVLDSLVTLLAGLPEAMWQQPTACQGWSVKDVALHLLGVEVGILSRKRDAFTPPGRPIQRQEELVALVNDLNATWVRATRRLSPRLLCDLLRFTGAQANDYFQALDPHALGDAVSWAGPQPAPVWLDLAREYTERWHHQQHIRDAVGRPGLKNHKFLAPVIDTFVRAWPHAYRHVQAPQGALVSLTIEGDAGGQWFLVRQGGRWKLRLEIDRQPDAGATLDENLAWRLFTAGASPQQALAGAKITGDRVLGRKILDMISIIA
ncbi:MAG: maleylpyruvate isomerase family mycothiol-dependent enzyme [Anaerolineae bacterium]|jgi:uncharacterized protein (TIGR03083 family)